VSKASVEIVPAGSGVVLREWNIDETTMSNYHREYRKLVAVCAEPSETKSNEARRAIRPVLEEHYKLHYPEHIHRRDLLHNIVEKIQNAAAGDPHFAARMDLEELRALNQFSRDGHHGDPGATRADPHDVAAYAARALRLVSGIAPAGDAAHPNA
jgi:hypothetical protein